MRDMRDYKVTCKNCGYTEYYEKYKLDRKPNFIKNHSCIMCGNKQKVFLIKSKNNEELGKHKGFTKQLLS